MRSQLELPETQPEQLYTPTQAAKAMGLPPRLVTKLCDTGEIEYATIGHQRKVTLGEIRRWVRSQTTPRNHEAAATDTPQSVNDLQCAPSGH